MPATKTATNRRPGQAGPARGTGWVPVRALADRHRERILAHLLALPATDRYLRFGYAASDDQIARYVDRLDFVRDEIFGVFNHRLEVVALAHLAYIGEPSTPTDNPVAGAEFGVSVAAHCRGRGWGARLFDRAVLHARNRDVQHMVIHALADNTSMLRIVRRAGAQVHLDGGDAEALLTLPPENFASHMVAMLEQQAAEIDYSVKRHVQHVDHWLQLLSSPPWTPTVARAENTDITVSDTPNARGAPHPGITQARDPGTAPAV